MKTLKGLALFLSAMIFTACGNFTEEITIKADGSGDSQMYTDIIPASTNMAMKMAVMFAEMDSTKTLNEDSLRMAIEAEVWEDFPESIDSIIDMSNEAPEEVKSQYPDVLANLNGFMRGSKAEGSLYTGLKYTFNSPSDIEKLYEMIAATQEAEKEEGIPGGNPLDKLSGLDNKYHYTSNEKMFARKVEIEKSKDDVDEEDIEKITEMFGDGSVLTVINTERKIKKVKGANLKSQEDYKVVFEYKFTDMLSGKADMDFEIIFEK
jgi:hypothetical protein